MFVEEHFKEWPHFFSYLQSEQNPDLVRFWILNALIEIVNKKAKHFSKEEQ